MGLDHLTYNMMLLILVLNSALACELACVMDCQAQGTAKTCWDQCGCPIRQDYYEFEEEGLMYYFPKLKASEAQWARDTFGCDGTRIHTCFENSSSLSCIESLGCGELTMRPKVTASSRMISLFFNAVIFLVVFGSFYAAVAQHFSKKEPKLLGYRNLKPKA